MTGVEFANVSYTLPNGRTLLRNVSLRVEEGTITALLGRSGSGKTTLLRMVNGLVVPTGGTVVVDGRTTAMWGAVELRRRVGYVIQETGLFPHMTVARNVGMALELAGVAKDKIAARGAEVLSLVGMSLAEYGERYPWQLSGGQRQRVGLARALAGDPSLLLMDEPFGALDPMTRAEMQTMTRDLFARMRKTVLLVTHDLDEALYLAERVVFLVDGEVAADLRSDEVLASEHPQVREYVQAVHRAVPA